MAYVKAHIQEDRVNRTQKAEDLVYNEQSSTQGTIAAFTRLLRTSLGNHSYNILKYTIFSDYLKENRISGTIS